MQIGMIPGMPCGVDDYVKNCTRCTLPKMPSRRVDAPIGNLLASRPLEVVAINYTTVGGGRLLLADLVTKPG